MKTVLLSIPNYAFISDLLRTKYIEYLSSKYRVIVLTPFINEQVAIDGRYIARPNIVYRKWALENPGLWGIMKTLRISWVNEFDYLPSIRYWYLRPNYRDNLVRKCLRTAGLPFSKFLTADFFTKIENALLPESNKFRALLAEYAPSALVTATPGFDPFEAELVLFAKRAGLSTVAVNFTWDNLTMNSKHIRKTDYLIAWNSVMKHEAQSIHHYPAEKIFVSGTPRFDPYFDKSAPDPGREKFLKSKGLNPEYPTIFHTTVTKAYPFQKKYIQGMIKLREVESIPYTNIFIRIHPLDLPDNYKEFQRVPNLHIEKAGEGGAEGKVEMSYSDLLNLKYSLMYTDLNVNYASTISIEACIFDKPVINIGYIDRFALAYDFDHYRPIVESGAVRVAKTDEDLARFINMYLEDPALDRERRRKIVSVYVGYTDGLSYRRSVDFLEQCFL